MRVEAVDLATMRTMLESPFRGTRSHIWTSKIRHRTRIIQVMAQTVMLIVKIQATMKTIIPRTMRIILRSTPTIFTLLIRQTLKNHLVQQLQMMKIVSWFFVLYYLILSYPSNIIWLVLAYFGYGLIKNYILVLIRDTC